MLTTSVNRSFYSHAITFSVIMLLTGVFQSVLTILVGDGIIELEAFPAWVIGETLILIIASVLFIKYLHYKNFTASFILAILVTISTLVYFFAAFRFAFARELGWLAPIAFFATLALQIAAAFTLIFSKASAQRWLKIAGGIMLGVSVVVGGLMVATLMVSPPEQKNLQAVTSWVAMFYHILPILYILNFREEQKRCHVQPERAAWATSMLAAQIICITFAVGSGIMLLEQASSSIAWKKSLREKTREWNKLFADVTFTSKNGSTLKYQLLRPANFDSLQTYPMVVCLPFGGGIEGAPAAQLLIREHNRLRYPSFLFVPFRVEGMGWGGVPEHFPTVDQLVFEAIEDLEANVPSIDKSRVYVTGVSLGGYGSWHFIATRPDLFAAAIPVCGGGNVTTAANFSRQGIWAFHGELDVNVPVQRSREMIEAIRQAGGNPKYTEFDGLKHNIWDAVTETPGLLDWLFAQRNSN